MAQQDLYKVLGVNKTANADEIRKSYRRLARKYHPDVNQGKDSKDAAEKFKEVTAAYEVLSDEKKRKDYDEFGDIALRSGFDAEKMRAYQQAAGAGRAGRAGFGGGPFGAGGAGGAGGFSGFGGGPFGAGSGAEGFEFNLEDLLRGGFGGRAPGGGRGMGAEEGGSEGDDVVAKVDLDFAQALRGVELNVDTPSGHACVVCKGTGDSGETCPSCKGTGKQPGSRGSLRIGNQCRTCHGKGKLPCSTCKGTGTVPGVRKVTVRVPPGADQGSRLRVAGMGKPGVRGGPPGDLYIEVHVRPHPHFRREGLDLHLTLPVTLEEAYLGASVEVPTPEGPVQLKIPPRSQSGMKLRLRGKGVKRGSGADAPLGDLMVELQVRLPDQADAALAEAIKAAKGAYSKPVRQGVGL